MRGLLTVAQVRARCDIDPARHCWLWQGAKGVDGTPRLWTFDHQRGEKRSMSGALAMWNIAHQEAPRPGHLVYRCCGARACLNPAHLKQARDKAEIGLHIRRAGYRIGIAVEARRANQRRAMEARGITPTAPEVVRAIRKAPMETSNVELAAIHGISHTTVSRIRRMESHKEVSQ